MNNFKIIVMVLATNFMLSLQGQNYAFPFGQELKQVRQTDTTAKKVFVLGVYASAVHAKWRDANGKVLVKALAVASEPSIFWTGDESEARKIINAINIPKELGRLEPANSTFNGPSGKCLDADFLHPLGLKRENAWLCDLVPYSCQNDSQRVALERNYDKYVEINKLQRYNMPNVPTTIADERIAEILAELKQSQADTIILLGDQPIKHFLSKFTNQYEKLSDFTEYGKPIEISIDNKKYNVIALAHPRQVAKLGKSNPKWYDLHQKWLKQQSVK
ncbi:hypothetical protein AGMMS49965_12770 [Bacteroidia bacterium]|nr:hypothetical protein AGMMS49965_12770 [Bacteroidia bacterium]